MISAYIGKPSMDFRKNNSDTPIYSIHDRETVRDFVISCSGISPNFPIAVEDVSFLNHSSQSFLLKFLEETQLDISLLARFDSILPTIISRCDRVVKFVPSGKKGFGGEPLLSTFERYKATTNTAEKWKILSEENPLLSLYLHKYKNLSEKRVMFLERG